MEILLERGDSLGNGPSKYATGKDEGRMMKNLCSPVFCALDMTDFSETEKFVQKLQGSVGGFKIGLEFFLKNGVQGVERLLQYGEIFLDLKLHDIPTTVSKALIVLSELPLFMVSLHIQGGREMMVKSSQTLHEMYQGRRKPYLVGITVLTAFSHKDFQELRVNASLVNYVEYLACFAKEALLDGVVCAGSEAKKIREATGEKFIIVCPGIRPKFFFEQDQKRCMLPQEALEQGANILVLGRPLTQAKDPVEVAKKIQEEWQCKGFT